MYYIYMLRCQDNSIYTGITTDLNRRMNEHFTKNEKCAKYTLNHTAKRLEAAWKAENRVYASKLEYYIKRLPKNKKELLIQDTDKLKEFLGDKINCELFRDSGL